MIVVIDLFLLGIGLVAPSLVTVFRLQRQDAVELAKNTLSNYISLLGIGVAVLAIVLTIIQMANRKLNIVKLVLDSTYFAPVVYFGISNIVVTSLVYLYGAGQGFIGTELVVRLAIAESYLFNLFVVLFAIVFFRTLKYISFGEIISLYISTAKKVVGLEKVDGVNERQTEFLQSIAGDLKVEVDTDIQESKVNVIDKIFDFYIYVQRENPQSSVVRGFKSFLIRWMVAAQKSQNIFVLHALVAHWRKLFQQAMLSGKAEQMDIIRLFPSELYQSTDPDLQPMARKLAIDYFPIRLKELGWVELWRLRNENVLEKIKATHAIVQPVLLELSELIKCTWEAGDINGLTEALNELKLLGRDYDIDAELRTASALPGRRNERYRLFEKFYQDLFAIGFANLSWLYRKYLRGKTEHKDYGKEIDVLLRPLSVEPVMAVTFMINILADEKTKFLWDKWIWNDAGMLSGEVTWLEQEEKFLSIGFIVLVIRNNLDKIAIHLLDDFLFEQATPLIHWVRTVLRDERTKRTEWAFLLNVDPEQIEDCFERVEEFLKKLEEKQAALKHVAVVAEPVSPAKVEEFRLEMYRQWKKSDTLTQVFEYFKAVNRNPTAQLMHVGMMRINFERARFMFTNKYHQQIYGLDWGYEVNEKVAAYFMQKVLEFIAEKDRIRTSVNELMDRIHPDFKDSTNGQIVLFIPFADQYTYIRMVSNSGQFRPFERSTERLFPFDYVGIYRDNIILVPLRSDALNDHPVAMRLPEAMTLLRREDQTWMDHVLQVDVIEITREDAEETAKKRFHTDKPTEDQVQEVMAGIALEINETLNFEMLDKTNIVVYTVK